MKKKYVAPASALLTLNFNENIAASSMESGGDSIAGGGVISFSQIENGCRKYYYNDPTAKVSPGLDEFDEYFNDLWRAEYVAAMLNCFSWR